jgi:hypothetical protein
MSNHEIKKISKKIDVNPCPQTIWSKSPNIKKLRRLILNKSNIKANIEGWFFLYKNQSHKKIQNKK